MIDWLVSDQEVSLHEAYALCSVAGDLKPGARALGPGNLWITGYAVSVRP